MQSQALVITAQISKNFQKKYFVFLDGLSSLVIFPKCGFLSLGVHSVMSRGKPCAYGVHCDSPECVRTVWVWCATAQKRGRVRFSLLRVMEVKGLVCAYRLRYVCARCENHGAGICEPEGKPRTLALRMTLLDPCRSPTRQSAAYTIISYASAWLTHVLQAIQH